MYSIVSTAIIHGIQSVPISVEADVSDGLPVFEMVGFLASEVQEAKERVRTALKNCGFALPPKHITINFTPANIRKSGSGFDLPVAVAVLTAFGYIRQEMVREYFVAGEVGLNGKVQPVNGILPMVAEAKERGMKKCMVPWKNAGEHVRFLISATRGCCKILRHPAAAPCVSCGPACKCAELYDPHRHLAKPWWYLQNFQIR